MTYLDTLPGLLALSLLATSFLGAGLTVHRRQIRRKQAAFAVSRPSAPSAHCAASSPSLAAVIPGRDRSTSREPTKSALLIPHGMHFTGMIRNADALRVEGEILSPFVKARELVVAPSGAFKGEIEVEAADIAGLMDGTIVVRGTLILRSTGKIFGVARCGRLHVEDGARIDGALQMLLHKRPASQKEKAVLF